MSRTRPPDEASARASAAATVVLPVPPLPVTTCSRTPSQSVSRALTGIRLSSPAPAPAAGRWRRPGMLLGCITQRRPPWPRASGSEGVLPMVALLLVILAVIIVGGLTVVGRSLRAVQQ